ncbi:protein SCO1/2 [Roseivivax lentus]|uniref:Protein SCO1/2 n=1 Tax=Roseivivax lentus TaxID=633194 RepID=A0A1N7JTE5_9RHOB|nr:SCO family protein [Roseivivax lentus]SIS52474.1 protein SCO1/2 [Roseivivax lentus]
MRWAMVIVTGLGLLALIAGTAFWSMLRGDPESFAACRAGAVAGDIGGPFTLVNSAGRTVTDADIVTEPVLLYFGYSFCPDICPFDVARNAEAVDMLAERGIDVTPVFVSVDPARDTPEQVGAYAAAMHPEMIGLTGTPEQVKAAADAFRVFYRVPEDPEDEFYIVDHTTFTYLLMPGAGFVEYFRRDLSPAEMADRVACFANAA